MNTMLKATSLTIAGALLLTIVIFQITNIEEIILQILLSTIFLTIYVYYEHKEIRVIKNES